MAHYSIGAWTLTGGALYLSQYLPTGPNGKSVEYYKNGFPEVYLGVAYKEGAFTGKAGVSVLNTKPYSTVKEGDETYKAHGIMTAFTPFVFMQYSKNLLQVRAKVTLAQSGEHLNLLSGYGISSYDASSRTYGYTPMQDLVSFVSLQYGKKVQFMGMVGYMKQLGTTEDLSGALWINSAADQSIQQAIRFTPTLAWNLGKFTVSLEYDITSAWFGTGARDARGLYADGKWITNHRLVNMVKFNF